MYGFKPKSARGKTVPQLADGEKIKPRGFKEGGLILGPGTGTSDSIETEKKPGTFIMPADSTRAIGPEALEELGEVDDSAMEEQGEKVPVRLSNGEFELPPEQVQALGEAVLTVLRDATHTPTGSGNPTGKGFAPNQFFANGGTVFGSRGLAGLREVIPKVQAMGYPQAQQPAQAPAGYRDLAALKAMIPKMEAMGYPQALADGGMVENEVTRVGNSYSGGNVGGNITVNGQAPAGTTSTVDAPTVAPAPAATSSAAPAGDPNPGMAGAQTMPSQSQPTAPTSSTSLSWADRNELRNTQVTASSIMDSQDRTAARALLDPKSALAPAAPPKPAYRPVAPDAPPAAQAAPVSQFGFETSSFRRKSTPYQSKLVDLPRRFADGGTVRDEEKQRLANQSAMYVLGAQTAAANRQPAPPESAASQVQNKAPTRTAAPFATTAPTSAGFMPGTRAVFNESGKAIGDLANQGRYAAAAGETARAALAYVPAVVDDVVGGAVRAVGPALADAGKQFLGMNEAAAPAPAPVPAAAVRNPSPAAPPGTTQANAAPTGQVSIQPMNDGAQPVAPPPSTAAAPQPQAEQVAPGAYRYGRGQYGDSPTGQQGMVSGPAGQPSAQNMAAAEVLASRQSAAGFMPVGVQAPVVRNSTNDWAARNALRNAEVSASSITNRPEWQSGSTTQAWSTRSNGVADPQGKVAAYRAAVANDQALQQAQPGMDKAALDANAALQREGTQQAGAITRTAMQEQGATAREAGRTALAGEEMSLKRTAAGFQTRALQRLENLQTRYEAEKDPAKRSELARQLREIQGKEQPSEWGIQVTPATKNADGSTTEGSVIRYNKATGQAERVDTGASANAAPLVRTPADLAKLPKGAQFMDEKGQLRVKN